MEAVACAPDGFDSFIRMSGSVFQLVSQSVDMYGDRCRIADRIEAPDFLEELFLGEYFIRMLDEEVEEVEFLACQCDVLAVQEYLAGFRTDGDIAYGNAFFHLRSCKVSAERRLWVAS